jgi:hypothetical protein
MEGGWVAEARSEEGILLGLNKNRDDLLLMLHNCAMLNQTEKYLLH